MANENNEKQQDAKRKRLRKRKREIENEMTTCIKVENGKEMFSPCEHNELS